MAGAEGKPWGGQVTLPWRALLALPILLAAGVVGPPAEATPLARNGLIVYAPSYEDPCLESPCEELDQGIGGPPQALPRIRLIEPDRNRSRAVRCSTRTRICRDAGVSFSPDGRLLAVSSDRAITLLRLPGQVVQRFSFRAGEIQWSPDSRFLAASGSPVGRSRAAAGLYVLGRARGRMRRLVASAGFDRFAWAPSGRALAFTSRVGADNLSAERVQVIRRRGSGRRTVAVQPGGPRRFITDVTWSIRSTIAWTVYQQDAIGDVFAVDPRGGEKRRLLRRGESAQWSPDRRRLIFFCYRGLCTSSADGRNRRLLTGRCEAEGHPFRWSRTDARCFAATSTKIRAWALCASRANPAA